MRRRTQIVLAEHSVYCNEAYLKYLKNDMSQSDYILTINTTSQLASERLYTYYETKKIVLDEFNEGKSIISRIHSAFIKKGNIYG